MGVQIIRAPDGGYNVFSTISDTWQFSEPCTEQQLVNWFKKLASDRAERDTHMLLDALKAGGKPYYQFTMTYKEANAAHMRTMKERNE